MEKKRHSDDFDFLSKLNYENGIVITVLVVFSIGLLYGLEYTGSTVLEPVKEFTIFAEKWEFVPNEITVKKGDRVKLNLLTSEMDENFSFKLSRYMYNDLVIIHPNETKTYEFIAYEPGTFIYRCETPCGHGKNLMVGKLIVKPY